MAAAAVINGGGQQSSSTGVLAFVRGMDLSRCDFSGDRFPVDIVEMKQAKWLYLNRFVDFALMKLMNFFQI
jgi:hypothetical protein